MATKSQKNQFFTIVEGMTSTGKACLLLMLTTHRLTKEAFALIREQVSLAGGFSFMQKGKPAYMKIDLPTLHSLLINLPAEAWVKPEEKESKVTAQKVAKTTGKAQAAKKAAQADILSTLTADQIAIVQALFGRK